MTRDLETEPTVATVRLKFLNFRIDVETNSLRVASRLTTYFGAYLAAGGDPARLVVLQAEPEYDAARLQPWTRPSQPGREPKESYYDARGTRYILKNRTGVLITIGKRGAVIAGDVERHVNQVVNLIGTLFGISLLDQGYAMLHASAVVAANDDQAAIFLGNSGSGKSSLALQLIEAGGYDFVSNDRVLLKAGRRGVHVVGLPKKPRVNPGTLLASRSLMSLVPADKRPLYEKLSPADLWRLEEKTDIDVGRMLGARERLDAWLRRAYSLEWKPAGKGLTVEPLLAEEALAAMATTAKDFGAFDLHREERDMQREFRRIARAAEFIAIGGKADPRALARRIQINPRPVSA
jgi:HprK-related kinase B